MSRDDPPRQKKFCLGDEERRGHRTREKVPDRSCNLRGMGIKISFGGPFSTVGGGGKAGENLCVLTAFKAPEQG